MKIHKLMLYQIHRDLKYVQITIVAFLFCPFAIRLQIHVNVEQFISKT